jgi:ferric-dicitrate binding protein FerR (iron transport regulator)
MSAERIDAETLAAFLDGKLEPAERERVLRILAEQPEEYEVFVDAAHIAARLERSTRTGGAEARRVSGATRRYPRAKWTVPLAIAASVAAIALIR